MSEHFLKLIPVNPKFVPSQTDQLKGQKHLEKNYPGLIVVCETTEYIEFVDSGENFESVFCNVCNIELEIEFWQQKMNESYKNRFENLSFVTNCCCKQTSLNDLIYKSPAGFARFTISIKDAFESRGFKELEIILGINLREVWAHY